MNAKGRLEQVVQTLGDVHIKSGIGVLKHDLIQNVGRGSGKYCKLLKHDHFNRKYAKAYILNLRASL